MKKITLLLAMIILASCQKTTSADDMNEKQTDTEAQTAKVCMTISHEHLKKYFNNAVPTFSLTVCEDGRHASGNFTDNGDNYISSVKIQSEEKELQIVVLSLKTDEDEYNLTVENMPLSPHDATYLDFSIFLCDITIHIGINPNFDGEYTQ